MTQTISRIRLDRPDRQGMNPGAGVLLIVAMLLAFFKLLLPQWRGLRWEFCYVLVGSAAVLVLDSIRAAIAAAFRPIGSPFAVGGAADVAVHRGGGATIGPVSSQKSQNVGGTESGVHWGV